VNVGCRPEVVLAGIPTAERDLVLDRSERRSGSTAADATAASTAIVAARLALD
jgi:hypothetical protein